MPHAERPTYTRAMPSGATVTGTVVTWIGREGKPVKGKLTSTGKVLVQVSGRWYGVYADHLGKKRKTATFSSKTTALEAAIAQERHYQAVREGKVSAPGELGSSHMLDYLGEYQQYLADVKVATSKHISNTAKMLRDAIRLCGLSTPASVNCEVIQGKLERHRRTRGGQTGTVVPYSHGWLNHHVVALRAFGRWLVARRVANTNPFSSLKTISTEALTTFERRSLSVEELTRLIDATRSSSSVWRGLDGTARAILYQIAAFTGLRLDSIACLTRESLTWSDGVPVAVHSRARNQKNRKAHGVPLRSDLGEQIRDWLGDRDGHLFPGSWAERGAQMLRGDLALAGIPYETPAGVFDFHALRVQFGTMCALSGVPLVVAQKLMDHSTPTLTAKIYSKVGGELRTEIDKLPRLG